MPTVDFPHSNVYISGNSSMQASHYDAHFGIGSLRGLLHSKNKPDYWKKEDFLLPLMKRESSLLISSGISISTDSKVTVSDITVLIQKHMFSSLGHR